MNVNDILFPYIYLSVSRSHRDHLVRLVQYSAYSLYGFRKLVADLSFSQKRNGVKLKSVINELIICGDKQDKRFTVDLQKPFCRFKARQVFHVYVKKDNVNTLPFRKGNDTAAVIIAVKFRILKDISVIVLNNVSDIAEQYREELRIIIAEQYIYHKALTQVFCIKNYTIRNMQSQTQYISSGSVIFENRIIDRRTPRAGAKRTDYRFPRGLTDLQKIHPLPAEKFLLDFLTIV